MELVPPILVRLSCGLVAGVRSVEEYRDMTIGWHLVLDAMAALACVIVRKGSLEHGQTVVMLH